MDRPEETKKTEKISMNDLKTFLDKKFAPDPLAIKPNKMSNNEMENFFKTEIIPVYKKLMKQLSAYKFESVKIDVYRRVATLRIADKLSLFHFKVDIDNSSRQFNILYDVSYRIAKKKKLKQILKSDNVRISFRDIDTINEDMIISHFLKWYMNKDEEILNDKERNVE